MNITELRRNGDCIQMVSYRFHEPHVFVKVFRVKGVGVDHERDLQGLECGMIFKFLLFFFIWHVICKTSDDFESLSNVQFKMMVPCLTIFIAKATFQILKFGNLRFRILISFKRYRSYFFYKWINGTVNYYIFGFITSSS